jgi:hypothetical protein
VRHSASARKRKGKITSFQALAFHPIGLSLYLHKYLIFFAPFAPLRE